MILCLYKDFLSLPLPLFLSLPLSFILFLQFLISPSLLLFPRFRSSYYKAAHVGIPDVLISKAVEVSGIAVVLFGRYWIKASKKMLEPLSATLFSLVKVTGSSTESFTEVISPKFSSYQQSIMIVLDMAKYFVGLERLLGCILKLCFPGPYQETLLHIQLLILAQLPPLSTTLRKTRDLSCFYLDPSDPPLQSFAEKKLPGSGCGGGREEWELGRAELGHPRKRKNWP